MHYIVSVPLNPNLATFIGKKGSENSITFYNRKIDENVIVALAPSAIEEKFYAVAESMLISSEIIVSTADLDKLFGEIIVACSLLDKRVIFTKDNPIEQFLNSVKITDHEFADKEELVQKILAHKPKYNDNFKRIDIDKAFPVKGLGTVVLGIVTKGTIKVHDELFHSSGKKISIRSMQSQDADITEATPGTRVGLAIKGMEHEEIEKGDLFSTEPIIKTNKITTKITVSKVSNEKIAIGCKYDLVSNFSFSIATVEKIEGDNVTLKLERSTAIAKDDQLLLIRTIVPRIFASGRVV